MKKTKNSAICRYIFEKMGVCLYRGYKELNSEVISDLYVLGKKIQISSLEIKLKKNTKQLQSL